MLLNKTEKLRKGISQTSGTNVDWYDNYNIGVEHIDNQHKELVKTLDNLQESLKIKGLPSI